MRGCGSLSAVALAKADAEVRGARCGGAIAATIRGVARTLVIALITLVQISTASAATLTILAPAAPGGGWDQTARVMQRVLLEIEPGASVQVDNIPGAAGTIGLARFVQSERGNPDAIMVTGLVMVSGVITNGSPVSLAATTPIARLLGEWEVIAVPSSSPYQSLADLITDFKRDPGGISWGGGSAGGTDDLLVRLMAEQLGLPASRVNYIAFSGGGAALAAVVGGQVTAGVSGFNEMAGQVAAGQLRVLAVSAPARVSGIDAPTLREAGVALDLANWRAVVAPPGLSDAARDALTARITRMAQSGSWQAALAQNGWDDIYQPGLPFRQFLLAEQARISGVLERLTSADTVPTRPAHAITPTTVPYTLLGLLACVGVAAAVTGRGRIHAALPAPTSTVALAVALLIQPLLLMTAGFVISSTVLFAVAAWALRDRRTAESITSLALGDIALGLVFSAALFVAFGRGLGVLLPPMPGLSGLL